jgi:hypothetical protein
MMFRCAALLVCCLLGGVVASAQINFTPQSQTERVETGFAHLPGRPHVSYSIRLLPVSSFPQLPPVVAQQLERRGCMVPQTYEAREPENVIHGSFEKKGSDDWALLCSVNRVTNLYVFFQSDPANPILLRHQPDSQWLGVEWSLDYGSAWGIATRPARQMPASAHADHDGIEDSFVEQTSTVHYLQSGRWTTIDGSQ